MHIKRIPVEHLQATRSCSTRFQFYLKPGACERVLPAPPSPVKSLLRIYWLACLDSVPLSSLSI